jgi:tetratricopeptide (TPR) repeat protein
MKKNFVITLIMFFCAFSCYFIATIGAEEPEAAQRASFANLLNLSTAANLNGFNYNGENAVLGGYMEAQRSISMAVEFSAGIEYVILAALDNLNSNISLKIYRGQGTSGTVIAGDLNNDSACVIRFTPAASGLHTVELFNGSREKVFVSLVILRAQRNTNFNLYSLAEANGIILENTFIPQTNPDGSVTMLRFNNFQIRITSMTDGRPKISSMAAEEFNRQIAMYRNSLQANPRDYNACIILACLFFERNLSGDFREAIKYCDTALNISREDAKALFIRGLAYGELGEKEKAMNDFQSVLRLDIQSAKSVYYLMGMIYAMDLRTNNEAINAFERVAALDPDFTDIKDVLMLIYSRRR